MDAQFLIQAISTVGFPIVMSGYLITRMETTIKDLTIAVNALTIVSEKGDK
ncbi:YvrJ family protein [Lysinibacillus xylanilyticus]|uniref:YvrJ family protein n=1 Tax=Lysinibacillus xylanilyticus TaxID=582475 RepID=UPI003D062CB0